MAWTSLTFKTAPDGTRVYFPWSAFGAGYQVADAAEEEAIRRYHGISTMIGLPIVIATAVAWKTDADLSWRLLGLALVFAHIALSVWKGCQLSKSMPRSSMELTHKAVREERLATISQISLWLPFGFSSLIAAGGVAIFLIGWGAAGGVVIFLFFGGFAALFGWGLAIQHRLKQTARE